MTQYNVYGIGAALVDTEIEVTDADLTNLGIDKGLMTLVDEARQDTLIEYLKDHITASRRASGGSAANSIIAVSAFGGKTYYSCRVADDENGYFYLDDLNRVGVNHNGNASLPSGITGKCLALITPDAERSMNTFLGISEDISPEDVNPEALIDSEYLYIEGYLASAENRRDAAVHAREIAQSNNTKVSVSLSDPSMVTFFRSDLQKILGKRIDLLFCNQAEALGWTGTDNVDAAAKALQEQADTFAITLGGKGALVYDGEQLHTIAPQPVTAVDTNGAGDMFAGAFLYGITHGMDYPTAGKLACRAAAAVVSQFGPRLPISQHKGILETL